MFFTVITLSKENNMIKVIKLSMIALAFSLVAACATTSDVENLQSQVDGLNTSVKQASADAASAQTTAADAAAKAEAAEAAANRAAQLSEDANSKLDRKFKRSMMK
jgi:septal ring factor EnvC (AmiA/AmiB activator)